MLPEDKKQEIVQRLTERITKGGGGFRCPMCGASQFTLADAYIRNSLQESFEGLMIGGPAIPSAAIICTNCGFLSQHALGILGLLPKADAKNAAELKQETEGKEVTDERR